MLRNSEGTAFIVVEEGKGQTEEGTFEVDRSGLWRSNVLLRLRERDSDCLR